MRNTEWNFFFREDNMLALIRVAICKYGGEVERLKKRLGHVQTPTPIFA